MCGEYQETEQANQSCAAYPVDKWKRDEPEAMKALSELMPCWADMVGLESLIQEHTISEKGVGS